MARLLFEQYRTWYGPPAIRLNDELVDGRTRANALLQWRIRNRDGNRISPQEHTITARSNAEAARLLCLAGHYDRARRIIPPELQRAEDVAAYCGCDAIIVAPACKRNRIVTRRMAPHATKKRRDAIAIMARALREAQQTDGTISADVLREALAPWLSD